LPSTHDIACDSNKHDSILIDWIANCWGTLHLWIVLGQIPAFDQVLQTELTDHTHDLVNFNLSAVREAGLKAIPDTEQFEFMIVSYAIAQNSFRRLMNEYKRVICIFLRKSPEDDLHQ
jgi:hypothetical protein